MSPTRCPNCRSSEVVQLADGLWTCRACGGYVPSQNGNIVVSDKTEIQTFKEIKKSKEDESAAAASMAWAKEQRDYELFANSWYAYVLARRKTTELIKPYVGFNHGNQYVGRDARVTPLDEIGFTRKQWNRRKHELEISLEKVSEYFDDIISRYDWHPSLAGLTRYATHISFNSGESEWYTPPEYIAAAKAVMGAIDLDPASSEKANTIVGAEKIYTEETDGLNMAHEWEGRIWMNAPYDGRIKLFTARYAASVRAGKITEGIALVNNATETEWFGSLVGVSSAVIFTTGRVKFLNEQLQRQDTPLQGQAILYTGNNPDKFIAEFSKFGWSAKL